MVTGRAAGFDWRWREDAVFGSGGEGRFAGGDWGVETELGQNGRRQGVRMQEGGRRTLQGRVGFGVGGRDIDDRTRGLIAELSVGTTATTTTDQVVVQRDDHQKPDNCHRDNDAHEQRDGKSRRSAIGQNMGRHCEKNQKIERVWVGLKTFIFGLDRRVGG